VELARRDPLADRLLDAREAPLRLLDARARVGADVEADLARVDRREEVAPDERKDRAGDHDEERERRGGDEPVLERPAEEAPVETAARLERPVERQVEAPEEPARGHV